LQDQIKLQTDEQITNLNENFNQKIEGLRTNQEQRLKVSIEAMK